MTHLALSVILLFLMCLSGCARTYYAMYSPGPLQIIGNDHELWMFLQTDIVMASNWRNNNSVGYDVPSSWTAGHFQELLILDKEGMKQHIKLKTTNNVAGVMFHPNISHVFVDRNNVYILKNKSMFYEPSLFLWNNNEQRFLLQPYDEGMRLFKSVYTTNYWYVDNLDSMTRSNGWEYYCRERSPDDCSFAWNGIHYTMSVAYQTNAFDLIIGTDSSCTGYPIRLHYESREGEVDAATYRQISREENGYLK